LKNIVLTLDAATEVLKMPAGNLSRSVNTVLRSYYELLLRRGYTAKITTHNERDPQHL
jgi:hypothetical protein